ncbi:serine-rich adhesin for platelets-like isoform X3 [Lytechinus variegatus]|uniref:serine-rich adhesin for platelets-like isoform X3 n=1 Tax=Lytechinus variegatus TaxID=7654 RepID=UPI001BB1BCAD|nr:serine-rich adhesin for platelets-like isoform X3 [Lytechinus variegatus]
MGLMREQFTLTLLFILFAIGFLVHNVSGACPRPVFMNPYAIILDPDQESYNTNLGTSPRCEEGHTSSGFPQAIYCGGNGAWDVDISDGVCYAECNITEIIQDDDIMVTNDNNEQQTIFDHGEVASFTCSDKGQFTGSDLGTCDNGTLLVAANPTCLAYCPVVLSDLGVGLSFTVADTPVINETTTIYYRDGDEVTYSCTDGYGDCTSDDCTSTCVDGSWDPPEIPVCVEIDECSSTPCQNNATCEDRINGYRCQCAAGFNGTNCEENINDCVGHACQNGGTCVDKTDSYECQCPDGFNGYRCENEMTTMVMMTTAENVTATESGLTTVTDNVTITTSGMTTSITGATTVTLDVTTVSVTSDANTVTPDTSTVMSDATTVNADVTTVMFDVTTITPDVTTAMTVTSDVTSVTSDVTTVTPRITTVIPDTTTSLPDTSTVMSDVSTVFSDASTTISDASTTISDASTVILDVTTAFSDAPISDASTVILGDTTTMSDLSTVVSDVSTDISDASTVILGATTTMSGLSTVVSDESTTISDVSTTIPYASTTISDSSTTISDAPTPIHASTTISDASTVILGATTTMSGASTTTPDASTAISDGTSHIPTTNQATTVSFTTIPEITTSATALPETTEASSNQSTSPEAKETTATKPTTSTTTPDASTAISDGTSHIPTTNQATTVSSTTIPEITTSATALPETTEASSNQSTSPEAKETTATKPTTPRRTEKPQTTPLPCKGECLATQVCNVRNNTCEIQCRSGYYEDETDSEIPCKEPVSIDVTLTITEVNGTAANFTEELNNSTSKEFKELESKVCQPFNEIYADDPEFVGCQVLNFSQGSIKVNYVLKFAENSTQNPSTVNQTIQDDLVNPNGSFADEFTIDPDSLVVEPLNECNKKLDVCDENSKCIDEDEKGYTCKCNPGYEDSVGSLPGRDCIERTPTEPQTTEPQPTEPKTTKEPEEPGLVPWKVIVGVTVPIVGILTISTIGLTCWQYRRQHRTSPSPSKKLNTFPYDDDYEEDKRNSLDRESGRPGSMRIINSDGTVQEVVLPWRNFAPEAEFVFGQDNNKRETQLLPMVDYPNEYSGSTSDENDPMRNIHGAFDNYTYEYHDTRKNTTEIDHSNFF